MKKRIRMVLVGVCLGIFLLIVQKWLHINEEQFLRWYWFAASVVVAVLVLASVIYHYRYQKKMRSLAALLEQGSTDAYMEGVKSLLSTAKGSSLRNVLKLNLSAGYCEKRQFDQAERILEELSQERLLGAVKMIHRLNLCVCYFYTSQNGKALSLYNESEKIFDSYRKSAAYGGNIAVLDMFSAIARKDYTAAKKQLEHARSTWNSPRLMAEYADIEKRIPDTL